MSKTLDKMTKAELVTLVTDLQGKNHALGAMNAQLLGDKARMRDDITALEARVTASETRRNFERVAYQSKARRAAEERSDGLTRAQRVIRAHRAAQAKG